MKKLVTMIMLATLVTTGTATQADAAQKVKVTYVENGGKTVKDQTVNQKSNPKEPSITRSGYTFKGWYTNKGLTKQWNAKSGKVTKNTTLYAKWEKTYKVTYIENGGKTVNDQTVTKNANPKEPSITRDGYVFSSWYTDKALTKKWDAKNSKITKDTTLYAKWEKAYTVTYDTQEGTSVASSKVAYNTNLSEPTPKRSGYNFIGWYTDEDFLIPWDANNGKVTKDMTLYAKWDPEVKASDFKIVDGVLVQYSGDAMYITVPNGVTRIAEGAFDGKTLSDVKLPNSVTHIDTKAFYYQEFLMNITLSSNLTTIGDYAFSECHNLQSVTIPNKVTSIGKEAFIYTALKKVSIPSSVTFIGDGAFERRNDPVLNITNNSYAVDWAYNNGYRHTVNGSDIKPGKQ